jgi:hypothetical protein
MMIIIFVSIMRWATYYILGKNYLEALQNMQRNPDKTYFSIDDESFPYKGVKGKAVASIS